MSIPKLPEQLPTWLPPLLVFAPLLWKLASYKPFEAAVDRLLVKWISERPKRILARRLTPDELQTLLRAGREEVETLAILIRNEYEADRVSVMEYQPEPSGVLTVTCLAEARTDLTPSVRGWDGQVVPPDMRLLLDQVHRQPGRVLYVPDVRLLEQAEIRRRFQDYATRSVFFQTIARADGSAGAMLAIAWTTPHFCDASACAALAQSGRVLAALLRLVWTHRTLALGST